MAARKVKPYKLANSPAYLIRAISTRNYVRLNGALRECGLSSIGWRILAVLNESDGHNIAELAERAVTERSLISRAIDVLEEEKLVERRPAPRDRRNVLLHITEAGRERAAQARPRVESVINQSIKGFSPEEFDLLMVLLRKMRDNVFRPDDS